MEFGNKNKDVYGHFGLGSEHMNTDTIYFSFRLLSVCHLTNRNLYYETYK